MATAILNKKRVKSFVCVITTTHTKRENHFEFDQKIRYPAIILKIQ